ncbi:MAG: acetyltransferase [Bacteroidales bacterium]|nr:acetyltransferase [Bacteroidales bacterium]
MKMLPIAILGTGGFAREVATIVHAINANSPTYELLGYVDNNTAKGTLINGIPVIGNDTEINNTRNSLGLILAFGEPHLKERVRAKYNNVLISFPTIIHPSVIMGDPSSIKIGEGCIICAGNVLTTNIEINDFVTLNLACTVGHDAVIGKFSSFMPSCNISGEVIVENKVYCGTGVKIINQVQIGDNAVIGAGAVVTQNIPANCTAVGIPAKPIKFIK